MNSSHEPPEGDRPIHRSQGEREFDGQKLSIHIIDMLHVQDDYNFVLRDEANDLTAVIDPSEAKGIIAFLEEKGWGLDYILNTHHHWDHTNGNPGLKKQYDCQVVGAARDTQRIPLIDIALEENESFQFGDYRLDTFDISGHTIGHIAYYCEAVAMSSLRRQESLSMFDDKSNRDSRLTHACVRGNDEEKTVPVLFPGDTLFAMGCGRMFEGTPEMFHASLQKIAALPDETVIYPAHEYTIPNGRFARSMEPDNDAINAHIELAKERRRRGEPSIPTTLAREKATNPFLRTHSDTIRAQLDLPHADAVEVFAALRQRKDQY